MHPQFKSEADLDAATSAALHSEATPYGNRIICPFCAHTRKRGNQNKKEMNVKLDPSNGMVVYHCHHCGEEGWVKDISDTPTNEVRQKKFKRKPEPEIEIIDTEMRKMEKTDLDGMGVAWFLKRGISVETADKYGCFSSVTWFRNEGPKGKELPSVGLPYYNKTVQYAAKMRAASGRHFTTVGHPQTAFGTQFLTHGNDIIITEGEPDTMAYAEAGSFEWGLNVCPVSVPFGAPDPKIEAKRRERAKQNGEDPNAADDKRYAFLWLLDEYLTEAETVYIAVDCDEPGDLLAEELARRVGKWKCKRVRFGDHKDANAQLQGDGPEALKDGIENAEPWPVDGLYEADEWKRDYTKLYEEGLPEGLYTKYPSVNELFRLVTGFVCVVTGAPSSGKSEVLDQFMVDWAETYGWKFAVWSPENPPKYHLPKLASKLAKKPFFHGPTPRMTPFERDMSLDWIKKHFFFMHDEHGELSSLDSIIERIRVAVLRYGVKAAVIDPYNYITQENENETKWVNDLMTKLKVTAKAHDIAIFIVAHPTKLQRDAEGKIRPPGGYEISGSANWFNKTDYGITVHRDVKVNPRISQFIMWKLKFNWMGSPGETELVYNMMTTCYEEYSYDGSEWEIPDEPVMDQGQGFE